MNSKRVNNKCSKNKEHTLTNYRNKINSNGKSQDYHRRHVNGDNDDGVSQNTNEKPQKLGAYKKAHAEYETIKMKKSQERERALKRKEEIKQSLDKYKQKKRDKYKKLAAKTKKGQPIMKNRIEMLLERIQTFKS